MIKTGRFQPNATVSGEIEAVEEVEVGDVIRESDDDVGASKTTLGVIMYKWRRGPPVS